MSEHQTGGPGCCLVVCRGFNEVGLNAASQGRRLASTQRPTAPFARHTTSLSWGWRLWTGSAHPVPIDVALATMVRLGLSVQSLSGCVRDASRVGRTSGGAVHHTIGQTLAFADSSE